jgi:hypothetical protein
LRFSSGLYLVASGCIGVQGLGSFCAGAGGRGRFRRVVAGFDGWGDPEGANEDAKEAEGVGSFCAGVHAWGALEEIRTSWNSLAEGAGCLGASERAGDGLASGGGGWCGGGGGARRFRAQFCTIVHSRAGACGLRMEPPYLWECWCARGRFF